MEEGETEGISKMTPAAGGGGEGGAHVGGFFQDGPGGSNKGDAIILVRVRERFADEMRAARLSA